MELRQLKYLVSIGESGTFTAAAKELYISQSALSQQIKRMEEELGVPLFNRTRNRLQFTQAGELLHKRARQIVKEVDEAKTAIGELEELCRGSLHIGVVQTVNAYLIPGAVSQFSSKYPDIQLNIAELSAPEIENRIENFELDMGISFAPPDASNITFDPLFEEELLFIAHQDHPMTGRETVNVSEFNGEDLILLSNHFCTRRIWNRCMQEAEITPNIKIEMNTIDSILSTLNTNSQLGTILPELTLQMKAAQALKAVHLTNPTPVRNVGILHRKGSYRSKASDAFGHILSGNLTDLRSELQ